MGAASRLRAEHPELLALRVDGRRHDPSYRLMTVSLDPADPTFLGYVCLGSEAGRAHVLGSMDRLIQRSGRAGSSSTSTWIRTPAARAPTTGTARATACCATTRGCTRSSTRCAGGTRSSLLESCSSGGLRIDLGLARHVHAFFLSDPDHTEHHLECVWGAARLLPPLGVLHWSWSQWRGEYPPTAARLGRARRRRVRHDAARRDAPSLRRQPPPAGPAPVAAGRLAAHVSAVPRARRAVHPRRRAAAPDATARAWRPG